MFDYDGDGRLDLFFVNGAALDDPMPTGKEPDKRDPRFWNRLYHNNGDGTFTDVTEKAGVQGHSYGMGVAVGDFDNDGRPDLYVTNFGRNILYHNNGDGTFTDVTQRAGVAGRWLVGVRLLRRLRPRRLARSLREPLPAVGFLEQPALRPVQTRGSRLLPSRSVQAHLPPVVSQQPGRHVYRRLEGVRDRRSSGLRPRRDLQRLRPATAGPISWWRTTTCPSSCFATWEMASSGKSRSTPAWPTTRMGKRFPGWVSTSPTTTTTAGPTSSSAPWPTSGMPFSRTGTGTLCT